MTRFLVLVPVLLAAIAPECSGWFGGVYDAGADASDATDATDASDATDATGDAEVWIDGDPDRPDGEAPPDDSDVPCPDACLSPPGPCYEAVGTCGDGRCAYAPLPASAPCSDSNDCTTGDACDGAGNCAGQPLDCSRPHTTGGFCSGGTCTGFSCEGGWGDCGGGWDDGCETPLTSTSNCGTCGRVCSGREIWCDGGACQARWLTIDVRDYIMVDSPGWKLCQADMACCHDGFQDIDGEWLIGTYCTSGVYMRDYLRRDVDPPYLFGVFKNSEGENFRCFTNPFSWCSASADYTPQAVPLEMRLPILPYRVVSEWGGSTGITPGAMLIPEYETWRAFDERGFSATDCHDLAYHGRIWQRNWAFIVDEVDFGGDVGVQHNVYVLESESSGVEPGGDWAGGQRMERYWKTTEFAGVREMGAEDEDCRASPGAPACNGVYHPQNITSFVTVVADDYLIPPVCRDF